MFLRLLNSLKFEAAEQQNGSGGEATAAPKKKAEVEVVDLEDGTKGEFVGKRKLNKSYILKDDGSLDHLRFEFRNGRVLLVSLPPSLLGQFAGHGGIQKYGDELAGMKPAEGQSEVDIDDMVIEMEKLDENIQKGLWSTRKEGDGMGGTSVLIKALIEYGGKSLDQVKAFLKDKDAKFKTMLRLDDKRPNKQGLTMAAIVKKIEAEKAAKGPKVDTAGALAELDAMEGDTQPVQTA
jgi:hypothetical protein